MSQITNNMAAWLPFEKSPKMELGPGPIPNPVDNEVVIKVAYTAINPADWKIQDAPLSWFKPTYPFILGVDISGTIVALGNPATGRFKIGDRVIGHCDSLLTLKPTNSAFQLYSTCLEVVVSHVPDSVPLSSAVVLPLAVDTAATALFKHLKLPLPQLEPKKDGRTILIWGGASSVGSAAIQLAVAAGLTVATTASAKNASYVKDLGATYQFDYNDEYVVEHIMKIMKPGDVVFDAINVDSSQKAAAAIVSKLGGNMLIGTSMPLPTGFDDVKGAFVNALDPALVDLDLGDAIWNKFMPQALAKGTFQAKPDPLIIEGGLEKIQEGIDILRKGVSAQKIVVEIAKEA